MRQINAEIISVGSELLLGQIANTNAQWLSEQLANIGVNVFYHHTVGDNYNRLKSVMKHAEARSNLVIVTGGLGPTDDDLTRDVAKDVLQDELIIDQSILDKVKGYFVKNGIDMTDNNRKQALVFKGGEVFQNNEGMAPGMFVEYKNVGWIFLPGVPREMKSLMNKHVIPFLKRKYQLNQMIISKVLRFIGMGESTLEHQLSDLIKSQTNPTIAPLAGEGEVTLRLTAKVDKKELGERLIAELEGKILERVGSYLYGVDSETVEERVFELLSKKDYTLSSAESLTGGRFIERLISIPGASSIVVGSVVSYHQSSKMNVLGVSKETVLNYGTVSRECASEMAMNIKEMMKSTIGISFTGNAGPTAEEKKPVGKVYIGVKFGDEQVQVHEFQFKGSRDTIRERTVKKGFELLYNYLKNEN